MTNERTETHACDLIRQAAIDALIRKIRPHNNGDGTITMCVMSEELVRKTLNDLPSAQPEITEEEVREWCYKRCLTVIDNALYLEMRSRWSASAQSEIVRCGDCKYFKVEHGWNCASYPICEVSPQRIITPDDYCSFAERSGG